MKSYAEVEGQRKQKTTSSLKSRGSLKEWMCSGKTCDSQIADMACCMLKQSVRLPDGSPIWTDYVLAQTHALSREQRRAMSVLANSLNNCSGNFPFFMRRTTHVQINTFRSKFQYDGTINWYPGHMAKATREIDELLSNHNIKTVMEIRDARVCQLVHMNK
jgi:hypothetical protein